MQWIKAQDGRLVRVNNIKTIYIQYILKNRFSVSANMVDDKHVNLGEYVNKETCESVINSICGIKEGYFNMPDNSYNVIE